MTYNERQERTSLRLVYMVIAVFVVLLGVVVFEACKPHRERIEQVANARANAWKQIEAGMECRQSSKAGCCLCIHYPSQALVQYDRAWGFAFCAADHACPGK